MKAPVIAACHAVPCQKNVGAKPSELDIDFSDDLQRSRTQMRARIWLATALPGLGAGQVRQLKQSREERPWLERLVADPTLDMTLLQNMLAREP